MGKTPQFYICSIIYNMRRDQPTTKFVPRPKIVVTRSPFLIPIYRRLEQQIPVLGKLTHMRLLPLFGPPDPKPIFILGVLTL